MDERVLCKYSRVIWHRENYTTGCAITRKKLQTNIQAATFLVRITPESSTKIPRRLRRGDFITFTTDGL